MVTFHQNKLVGEMVWLHMTIEECIGRDVGEKDDQDIFVSI